MAACRQRDVDIRKLRKKLRQIENLESLDRELASEEYAKISQKASIRRTLLELLAGGTDLQDSSHDLSSASEADTSQKPSEKQLDSSDNSSNNLNEEDCTGSHGNSHVTGQLTTETVEKVESEGLTDTDDREEMTTAQKRGHTDQVQPEHKERVISKSSKEEYVHEEQQSPVKKPRAQLGATKKETPTNLDTQEKERSQKLHQMRRRWKNQAFQLHCLQGHNDLVSAIDVNEDWLLSGSRDTMVKLWHLNTGTEERSFGGHTGTVTCVVLLDTEKSQSIGMKVGLSPVDCLSLGLSGSTDCSIKLWNLNTGELIKSIYTYSPVSCLAFISSAHLFISASDGGKVELWDMEAGLSVQSVRAHSDAVSSLQVDGNHVYTASVDGVIKVHELRDQSLCTIFESENIKTPSGVQLACRSIHCLLPVDGRLLYGDDGVNIKMLNWKTGIVNKIGNHVCEFGATDCLYATDDLLLSSGYDLDTGIGFINVRSLPGLEYLCTVNDEEMTRVRCLSVAKLQHGELRIVTGGADLIVYKTTSRHDGEDLVSCKYMEQLNNPAQHSDVDSDTEFSDSETEAGTLSSFRPHRRSSKHESPGSKEGWLSYCSVL